MQRIAHLRRLSLALAVLAACAGSPVFPPPMVPSAPSKADWPDTGAVILEDIASFDYRLHEGDDGKARVVLVLEHRRRIKILAEEGLAAARVELRNDGLSTLEGIVGRAVSPSGRVTELETFETLPWPEAKSADALRVVRMTIPGAEVGGLVEYRYVRTFAEVDFVPPWLFGDRYPVLRSELSLVMPGAIKVDYRFGRGTQVEEALPLRRPLDDGRERLVFVLQDLPAFFPEPHMPSDAQIRPWLMVQVTQARLGEETVRTETWDDIKAHLAKRIARVGASAGEGTPATRYRAVRDSVHAVAALGLGILPTTDASNLLVGKPAAPRDAAALLLTALEGSGAEAYPALVTGPSGPLFIDGFASFAPFVRLVVAVRAKGAAADKVACKGNELPVCRAAPEDFLFLDPACAHCRYGELPFDLLGGRALVFLTEGEKLVTLPQDPPLQHRLHAVYDVKFTPDGKASGKVDGELTGNLAGKLRSAFDDLQGAQKKDDALSLAVVGALTVPRLSDTELTALVNVDQPLGFTGKVLGRLDRLGYERYQVRPLDLIGSSLPDPLRSSRRYDALLDGPREAEHELRLDLPVGYEVETVPPVRITTPFAEYEASYTRRERILTFTRKLKILARVVRRDDWQAFREFADQVAAFEQKGVRIWIPEESVPPSKK